MRDRDQPWIELACDRARTGGAGRHVAGVERIERLVHSCFPTAQVVGAGHGAELAADLPAVSVAAWRSPHFDPQALDAELAARAVRGALRLRVALDDGDPGPAIIEMLSRAQPYLDRRNEASASDAFERVLAVHHALHDLAKPLVRADYAHALDVWQWTLRLDASASFAVQAAALFHDVERLVSEADARIEQHADDYVAFKRAHARAGGAMAKRALAAAGLEPELADRTAELVAKHEGGGGDHERDLLNDADALSFFSQNSAGFVDYYGPAHARTKVAYTLGRLSAARRHHLAHTKLRSDVAALVSELRAPSARGEVGP